MVYQVNIIVIEFYTPIGASVIKSYNILIKNKLVLIQEQLKSVSFYLFTLMRLNCNTKNLKNL